MQIVFSNVLLLSGPVEGHTAEFCSIRGINHTSQNLLPHSCFLPKHKLLFDCKFVYQRERMSYWKHIMTASFWRQCKTFISMTRILIPNRWEKQLQKKNKLFIVYGEKTKTDEETPDLIILTLHSASQHPHSGGIPNSPMLKMMNLALGVSLWTALYAVNLKVNINSSHTEKDFGITSFNTFKNQQATQKSS